jgi:hypothetical protein
MNSEETISIGLLFPDNMPSAIIEDMIQPFNSANLEIDIKKVNIRGPFASIQWAVPTVITAYLLKPYFESFLKEAGKDHYQFVKQALHKYVEKGRRINTRIITSDNSIDKLKSHNSQSRSVSLILQLRNKRFVKLLFNNDLDQKDWDNAIDSIIDYVNDHYECESDNQFDDLIKDLEKDYRFQIYVVINKETKKLEFYDDKTIGKMSGSTS